MPIPGDIVRHKSRDLVVVDLVDDDTEDLIDTSATAGLEVVGHLARGDWACESPDIWKVRT